MTDDRSHGWKVHADGQAQAWARLSHLERLRWLQSAKHFAQLALDAAARRLADAALLAAGETAAPLTTADPTRPTRKPSPG